MVLITLFRTSLRSSHKHQRNYSTIMKERLALILALEHFNINLCTSVHPVLVFTYHNPLTFIHRMKNKNQNFFFFLNSRMKWRTFRTIRTLKNKWKPFELSRIYLEAWRNPEKVPEYAQGHYSNFLVTWQLDVLKLPVWSGILNLIIDCTIFDNLHL